MAARRPLPSREQQLEAALRYVSEAPADWTGAQVRELARKELAAIAPEANWRRDLVAALFAIADRGAPYSGPVMDMARYALGLAYGADLPDDVGRRAIETMRDAVSMGGATPDAVYRGRS